MYADFSSALPSAWTSPTAQIDVVEAVPFKADSAFENAREIDGKIALVLRGTVPYREKVERASEAGAAGVVVVNTSDTLEIMTDKEGVYKSEVPVLMIKSSDAARLREHGSALIRDEGKMIIHLSLGFVTWKDSQGMNLLQAIALWLARAVTRSWEYRCRVAANV